MIAIIDCKLGNVGSVKRMIERLGHPVFVSSSPDELQNASKFILPGIGSFDAGMERLEDLKLKKFLNQKILIEKLPILGICLGMQLFTKRSDEGTQPGLGWIDGETVKFSFEETRNKVPHMGWNTLVPEKCDRLFGQTGKEKEWRFYFVHSYHVRLKEESEKVAVTHYGYPFCSAFQKENIFGVQFHPEKSHRYGLELLSNFAGSTQ